MEVKAAVEKNKTLRDRSGSQAGQTYYNSNYQGRNNNRNYRKNSTSTRQYSRCYQNGDTIKSQDNSPDAHKHWSVTRSALTQTQSTAPLPYTVPIPVEQLHSSISEIMQHQSALERLRLSQMPLEPIENYYGNRKVTWPAADNSQWTKKENSPAKDGLENTTPSVTSNKEPVDINSDESNNIRYRSKEEGFKQDV